MSEKLREGQLRTLVYNPKLSSIQERRLWGHGNGMRKLLSIYRLIVKFLPPTTSSYPHITIVLRTVWAAGKNSI